MTSVSGKKMIPFYFDEAIYRTIKVYSALTDQSMQEVLQPIADEIEQSLIKLCGQINEMNRQAELERQRKEEEQRIASENPLIVPGHEVDPLGPKLEEPVSAF